MPTSSAAPVAQSQAGPTDPALLVVLRLYEAIDSGRARSAVPLFAENGVFEGPKGLMEGRAAIGEFFGGREDNKDRHTVHTLSNIEVRPLDDGDVLVRGIVIIYASDPSGTWQLERVTRVKHVLRPIDGDLLITKRLREPLELPATDGVA